MAANNTIQLHEFAKIAESKTRHCYLHPEDEQKVIKVVVRPPKYPWRKDANMKEWLYYQRLLKLSIPLDFIPRYYGFVETNLGTGLVSECISDYDGNIAVRIKKVLDRDVNYDISAIERLMENLTTTIIDNNIQLFDLNSFNILVQRLTDTEYRVVSIDIKGPYNNYEFIPISTYIPFFSRQKLKRRCGRVMERISSIHNDK